MTLTELFTSIADTIRGRNQYAPEKIKAVNFPDEIDTACNESERIGFDIGIEQGKQEEHDAFWNKYQDYGNRTIYYAAFQCYGYDAWDFDNFKPKYDINPASPQYMFWNFGSGKNVPLDLKQHLTDIEINMDFSESINMSQVFIGSKFTHIPYLNCPKTPTFYQTFQNSTYLETIDGIYLTKAVVFTDAFKGCSKLKNILFDGEIGNSISFADSPLLTVVSLRSILTALSKNSTYANGKTATFDTASRSIIEADSECATQLASAVSAGWTIAYS